MQHPVAPPLSPILVVGAGPTGLVAALLLARLGRPVLIVERHAAPWELPRAVHLDDEVHRILQSVGIGDAFAAISRPALGLRLLDREHRVLAELRRDALVGLHGWPQANMFDQPDLESLLHAEVARQPLVTLRHGVELVALQGLSAGLSSGQTVECAAVLGCDGEGSTVRGLLGVGVQDLGFTERWLVVDAACDVPLGHWPGVHQVCDPRGASTFLQVGARRYRWEFQHARGALPELLAPWLGDVPFDALTVLRTAEYTFRARLAERWRTGRVLLLGDAAHETPPFIGQGLGAGVRDAANLAWKLDRVLAGAPEALLSTYESERRPHALQLIRAAKLIGTAMTGGQDRAAAVRRGVLAAACRVPGLPSAAVSFGAPRLRRGPLVRRGLHGGPSRLAGGPVPQPRVGGRRLDDVLGEGFAVVSTVPSPPLTELARRLGGRAHVLPELADWLARGHATAAVIRPDRVVLAAGSPAALLADAPAWLHLLGR